MATERDVEYGTGPCGCGQTEPCCDSCLPPSRRMDAGADPHVKSPLPAQAGGGELPSDAFGRPHGVEYDRLGWICSVCNGWNHSRDRLCTHTHTHHNPAPAAEGEYADWCPVCGGKDGQHLHGCEDGSEVL